MPKTFYRSPQPSLSGNRRILLIASYLDGGRDAVRSAQRFGVTPQLLSQLLAEIKAQGLLAWCMAQRDSDLSSSRNQELLQAEAESGGRLQRELEQLNLFQIDAFRLAIGAALERHQFTVTAVAQLFHVPESDVFNFQRKLRAQGYEHWLTQQSAQDIALVQPEIKVTMSQLFTGTAPRPERSRPAHSSVNGAGAAHLLGEGHSAQPMSGERRIHITLTALSQVQTVSDLSARFQIPAMQIEAWQQEAQALGVYQWCQEQRKRDEADAQAMLQIARERLQAEHRLDDYTLAYAQIIAVGAVLDQKVSVAKAAKILELNEEQLQRLVKQAQGREREAWAQQLLASVPKPTAPKSILAPATYKSPRKTSTDAPNSTVPHQPRVFGSKQAPAPTAGATVSGVTAASVAAATSAQTAPQRSASARPLTSVAAATPSAPATAPAPRVFGAHTAQQSEQQAAATSSPVAEAAPAGNSALSHKSHRLSKLKSRQTLLTAKSHQSGAQATSSVSATAQSVPVATHPVKPKLTGADRISLLAAYVDKQFSLGKLTASSGLSADDLAQLEAEAKEQGLIKWCLEQHRRDQGQKLESALNLVVSCDIPWFTAAALSAVRAQQYSLETVAAIFNLDQDELRAQLESQPLSQAKSAASTAQAVPAAAEPKGTTTQVQVLSAPAPELKTKTVAPASTSVSKGAASARPATAVAAVGKSSAAQQTSKLAPPQAQVAATATQAQAAAKSVLASQPKSASSQPAQPQTVAPRATGEQIIFSHPPVAELSAPDAHLTSLSQSMATLAATAPRTPVKFKYPKQAQAQQVVTASLMATTSFNQTSAHKSSANQVATGSDTVRAAPAEESATSITAAAPQLSGVDRIRLVAAISCDPCDYAKLQAVSGLSQEQLEALKTEALAQGLIPWCQAQHQLDQEHHAQAQLPQLKQKIDCTASDLFGQAAAAAVHSQGLSPEQVAQLLLFEHAEDVAALVELYYPDSEAQAQQEIPPAAPAERTSGAGATDLKPVAVTEASAAPIKASPAAVPETAQADATVPADATSSAASQDASTAAVTVAASAAASAQTSADSVPETTPADVAAAPAATTNTVGAQSTANQAADPAITGAAPAAASATGRADSVPKPAVPPTATSAVGPATAAVPAETSPEQAPAPAQAEATAALSNLNGASRIALAAACLSGKFTPQQLMHATPGLTADALTRLQAELAAANFLEWCIDQRYLDQKQGLGSQLTLNPELLVDRAALVEFRAAAVQGVLTKKMSATQVAALLDLAESAVTSWVQEARAQGYEAWLETTRERLQQVQDSAATVSFEPQLRPVSGRRLIELVAAHYAKGFSPNLLGQIVGVSAQTIESCLAQLKEQGLYAWCHSQCLADRNDPKLSQLLALEAAHPLPPDFQVERVSLEPFKQAALQALREPGNSPETVGAILGLDPVQIKAWFLAESSAADNALQAPEPIVPKAPVAPAETVASEVAGAVAPELVGTQRVNVLIELLECEQAGIDHGSVCRAHGLSAAAASALLKEACTMGLVAWCEAQTENESAESGRVAPRDGSLLSAFQLAAVEAVLKQGRSVATVASLLHLPRGQLATWSSQAMIQGFEHWAQSFDQRSQELALGAQYWEAELTLESLGERAAEPEVAAAPQPDELVSPELKRTALNAVQEQGHSPELVAEIMGLKLEQLKAWLKPTAPTTSPRPSGANLSGERCIRIVAAYKSAKLSSAELCARYQVSETQVLSLVRAAQQQGLIAWAQAQRARDESSAESAAQARRDCWQLGLDLKLDEVEGLRYEATIAVVQEGMAAVAVAALLGLRWSQLMAWVHEAQDH